MNSDIPKTEEQWAKIERELTQNIAFSTSQERLARVWERYLKGCDHLSSHVYENLLNEIDGLEIWSELREEAHSFVVGLADVGSGVPNIESNTVRLEFCMGAALAKAVARCDTGAEIAIINAAAFINDYNSSRRAGFISAFALLFQQGARAQFEPSLRKLANLMYIEAPDATPINQKEAFRTELREWCENPELETIWYKELFNSFFVWEARADVFNFLEVIDPEMYLSLLEETRNPPVVSEALAIIAMRDDASGAIKLLAHSPTCFEWMEDSLGYKYSGTMTTPILILKILEVLSQSVPPSHNKTNLEEEQRLQAALDEFGSTIARRADGSILALHTLSWLLWRHSRKGGRAVPDRLTLEEVMIGAICNALSRERVMPPEIHSFDPDLEVWKDDAIRPMIETGHGKSDHDFHSKTYDHFLAYLITVLSKQDVHANDEEVLKKSVSVCMALYRQIALRQLIGLQTSHSNTKAMHVAYMFWYGGAPNQDWSVVWNELSQQRKRSKFRFVEERGHFESSRHHIDVGIGIVDWAFLDEPPLADWVPPFWKQLFRLVLHVEYRFFNDETFFRERALQLMARIPGLAKKQPDGEWLKIAAWALREIGGDAYLLTLSLIRRIFL